MTKKTFTTSKGIIKVNHLKHPEVWCKETQTWIGSDEEKYKQEKQISELIYKGKTGNQAESIIKQKALYS